MDTSGLRQPGEGVDSTGLMAVSVPRIAGPLGADVPRGAAPIAPGHALVPQADTGIMPVLVDPSYGRSSSDTAPSMASVAGALAGVLLEDAPPPAGGASTQMFNNPPLLPCNLVTIARMAFGPSQALRLAPSIIDSFDMDFSLADLIERLLLLWAMRRDVASQVREIILLGQVCQEPPAVILNELLDLTELYMRDTD